MQCKVLNQINVVTFLIAGHKAYGHAHSITLSKQSVKH